MASQDEPGSDYRIGDIIEFVDEDYEWRALIIDTVIKLNDDYLAKILLLKSSFDDYDTTSRVLDEANIRKTTIISRI